jgi:hypothetical protein
MRPADRKKRRRQQLQAKRDVKKYRRFSKHLAEACEESERRAKLRLQVSWWTQNVLEPCWYLPKLMQIMPQAFHIPCLLTCGLVNSVCVHSTFAWDACDIIAGFQQTVQFRFACAIVLLANWSGKYSTAFLASNALKSLLVPLRAF